MGAYLSLSGSGREVGWGGGGRGDRPSPAYLKVWIRHCTDWSLTRVVFKLGSKVNCVCYGLATPHGDWLFDKTRAIFSAKEK